MAKIQSPVWNLIRGSICGITYLSNQYHQIVARGRTAPVQPNTTPQTRVRSMFTGCLIRWKDILTQPERDDWQLYAQTCQYVGPLGPYTVPGRLLYIAGRALATYLKTYYAIVGALCDKCPSEPGFYSIGGITLGLPATPKVGITITVTNDGTHQIAVLANVSRPYNATRLRFKGPWDTAKSQALAIPPGTAGVITIENLVTGKIYFVRVHCVVLEATLAKGHAITTPFYGRQVAGTAGP